LRSMYFSTYVTKENSFLARDHCHEKYSQAIE